MTTTTKNLVRDYVKQMFVRNFNSNKLLWRDMLANNSCYARWSFLYTDDKQYHHIVWNYNFKSDSMREIPMGTFKYHGKAYTWELKSSGLTIWESL